MAEIGDNGGPTPGNWVAIDRDLRFHEIVGFLNTDGTPRNGPISETDAWFDLICEANYKDRKVNNKGKVMLIERGQLMAGRAWLAKRWGWTENKVRWFFKKLEDAEMIARVTPQSRHNASNQTNTQKRAHFANVITLCNYNIYQTLKELDDHLANQPNDQSTTNQQPHLNKETKITITTLDTRSRVDLDILETKLFEAANGAMASPAIAPQVLVLTDPIKWIENGCDLETDILPTVKARAHKMRRGSVKSWSYFTEAVADAKAARTAPMPEGRAPPGPRSEASEWHEKQDAARAFLLRREPVNG